MFDIGFIEILVISIVALIVIGPERLPMVARTVGLILGRARGYVNAIRTDVHNEMRMDELKNLHTSVKENAQIIEDAVRQEVDQIRTMTDLEGATKTTSLASTNTDADVTPETNALVSSTESVSQQPTSSPGNQKYNTPDK